MWARAAGVTDTVTNSAAKTETVYAAASITKTFTAAFTLLLVRDGLVELDEPATRWLAEPAAAKATGHHPVLAATSWRLSDACGSACGRSDMELAGNRGLDFQPRSTPSCTHLTQLTASSASVSPAGLGRLVVGLRYAPRACTPRRARP